MSRWRGRGSIAVGLLWLVLWVPLAGHAERLWLVVGSSDASAAAIALKSRPLSRQGSHGLLVRMRDCGDAKNAFVWAFEVVDTAGQAQPALARARKLIPDAYVKPCDARPGSLLALRIDAVDRSIADVPADAVNWSDEDRVSSVQTLAGPAGSGRRLLVTRYFSKEANDPLEGRRARVSLVAGPSKPVVLLENCIGAAHATAQRDRIALQCEREQAADALLHAVLVFDTAGRKLAEVGRCRNPRWLAAATGAAATLVCEAESVDAVGRLSLRAKRVALPPG